MAEAAIPIGLMAGGTILSAAGQIQAGNAAAAYGQSQQQAANYSAAVLDTQAGQERASSQRSAEIIRRNATLANSAVTARAAASGGGVTNPTVTNIEGRIAGMGEYNALSALYSGEERARGEENQATLDRYTGQAELQAGKAKQSASQIGAFASILSGGSSLYTKYGMGSSSGGPMTSSQAISNYGADNAKLWGLA
jgi:hypothetical protein